MKKKQKSEHLKIHAFLKDNAKISDVEKLFFKNDGYILHTISFKGRMEFYGVIPRKFIDTEVELCNNLFQEVEIEDYK